MSWETSLRPDCIVRSVRFRLFPSGDLEVELEDFGHCVLPKSEVQGLVEMFISQHGRPLRS
jgi:hypothetical protein